MNAKHLVFLFIFMFNFVVDSPMASSHNTTIEFQSFPLQHFTLRDGVAGESNLLASFSGSIMYTTPVHFSSNRTNSSASFSVSTDNLETNRNVGSPGGYLGLLEIENTILNDPDVELDADSLNWLDGADCMDAGVDLRSGIDNNRSQKILKPVLLLEMDLSCYFQEEELSYGMEYLNPQNVTDKTFDSGIRQYELYPKLIGLILVFFLWCILGACKQVDCKCIGTFFEQQLAVENAVSSQPKRHGNFDDEEAMDMNGNPLMGDVEHISVHDDLEGDRNNHMDTLCEKYIKARKDFQVEDVEFDPREAILQILRVVRKFLENKHLYSSYEHHLSSLLASTDGDEVEACLQTLSAFLRKSVDDSKPLAFAQGPSPCLSKQGDSDSLQPAHAQADDTLERSADEVETINDDENTQDFDDEETMDHDLAVVDCQDKVKENATEPSFTSCLIEQGDNGSQVRTSQDFGCSKSKAFEVGKLKLDYSAKWPQRTIEDQGSCFSDSQGWSENDLQSEDAAGVFIPGSCLTNQDSYHISPYQSRDDLLTNNKKFVPSWARKSAVAMVLPLQLELDPETIFQAGTFCNVDQVVNKHDDDKGAKAKHTASSVKALEAAKAAFRREQEKEDKRKKQKEAYKIKLAKAKEHEARLMELYKKMEQEEMKRKEADLAARLKHKREQDERKQMAKKTKQQRAVTPWRL